MTVNGYNTGPGTVTITLTAVIPSFSSPSPSQFTLYTSQMLLTNAITDNVGQHNALMYSTDAGASWARVPGSSDTEANGGTGMTTLNGGCYSLAANTARTRFMVSGGDSASATRKVYLSNDGFNWNRSVSSPNSTQFAWVWASLWVGGGYNRWLVGGSDVTTQANGRIMYSADADAVGAWVVASPATYTGTIVACFAANTDFSVILAGAASGNTIYRAANNGGTTWTTVSISSTPLGGVRSIAFSPSLGRWVAVGGSGGAANTIIYSTDATATAWIALPLQAKSATTAIFKNGSEATRVIWDALGGRFIVGGWNGANDYTSLTNVAGLDGSNNNPGYTMAYSADGVNWTPVSVRADNAGTPPSTFGPFMTRCREIMALDVSGEYTPINTGYSVTWNSYANRFVATGNGTTPVVYSNDGGSTWTPANQQPQQQAIAVAGGGGAAAGTGTVSPITYTTDGKTWSQAIGAKEVFGASATVLCVKYGQTSTAISPNGRIWVAGATSGSNSCLAFSQNGIRWTAIASANTMIGAVRAITYAPVEKMRGASTGTSSSSSAATAASGVGNGVWVAGGDTTNSLIFSYDGISWSEVPGSLAILNTCNACAFGNGVFVAGGSAGSADPTAVLAYSVDGINWQPIRGTKSRISVSATVQCITYGSDERGRGLWVAGASYVSGNPTITLLYSYNGIDWIGINDSSTSLGSPITGVAYGVSATTGQGLWVASVYRFSSYSFIFSTTGRDGWTSVTNTKTGLFELSGSGATGIAYLNGVWYATGLSAGISTGRTLAYSYDGSGGWFGVYPTTNMYGSLVSTFSATSMNCIATTNDYLVPSVGASPAAMVPVRSIGWTAGSGSAYLQHPTILFGTDANAISADGGRSWGSSTVSLGSSAFRGGVCNDAIWNGSVWVAVGYDAVSGAKVATSRDGVVWSQIPAGAIPISGVLYSVMWNGTVWMVGGDGSPTNDANTASIAWSYDLASWYAVANTDTKLYLVKRISWNGMYWVAVGLGSVSTMMYSKDKNGLVWEDTYLSSSSANKTASITSVVNDAVWGGGRWVAVGRGNDIVGGGGVSILYSADTPVVGGEPAEYAITGRRWTGVAASAQLFPYGASSVCWNGKRFVATGPAYSSKSGTAGNIIAWSADGISWTAYSTTKTVAPGQRWVAVGSGSAATIATSADGRTWTDVSGSALLFSDISGASVSVVNTMLTGARAVGWNGSSLIVGGSRSATTMTDTSQLTATATTGRTTIPVCAFIGSGNGVMGGGTTNVPDASFQSLTMRTSSSVFITHLDVNIREASQPWANMWLNTYSDLSANQLFQVTPESQTFSSALKWNGWSWVANFGMTTINPATGEQYGSVWYCTDPLARVGWSVASNYATPRILMGQGGYAALEWNGAAWLACGYDPNNNNLIYTTDKYGAVGWTAVTGIVSGGSASFQPVCIASSSRFWVVGGSLGATSAIYYTNDRTGATGWKAITTAGGLSVLPGIRITSVGYNGTSWICCGGGGNGGGGTGTVASSISWRTDSGDDIGTGWAAATLSGSSGGIPENMSNSSSVAYNAGAVSPCWVVVGDVSGTVISQIAYTTNINGSAEWKKPSSSVLTIPTFTRLNGIAWTGYSWIASCGAGNSRIVSTTDITAATAWNNTTNNLYSPTMFTNAVAYANIPISLLTTGMVSSAGVGTGAGAMWRAGVGRAQGLLPGGGGDTTSVIVRSANGAEGTTWSQVYSRNFLVAVGGGAIRDASGVGGTNRMAYSYDGGLSWTTNNTSVLTTAAQNSVGTIRTVKYSNGIWVAGGDVAGSSGSGGNCLAWSRDGVNWVGAGGTQVFGSAGACYAVCCNDRGRWVAVGGAALTTAGTYTNASGSIYTMAWSDDGMNWTPILGSRALFGIVCQGVTYGADASGVGMWTAIGRGGTAVGAEVGYTGCAYSYDGKTWYLSQTSASLFGTSANVLTERYAPVAGDWKTVAINSNGQIQFAAANAGLVWRSLDYGVSWSALTLPSRNWASVAVSSTGQYVMAASSDGATDRLYNSSDYGMTWVGRGYASSVWKQVAISATGQYQVGVANVLNIQISRDYGVTWVVPTSGGTSSYNLSGVAISSSGQYITFVCQGFSVQQSSDYGVNYTSRSSSYTWSCVAMSSTGQIQIGGFNTDNMYVSINYGVDWNVSTSPPVTGAAARYRFVAISSTGQYRSGVTENTSDTIKRSNNYDAGWSTVGVSTNYFAIAMSSTGQYQTSVSQTSSGIIFISSNFGETWSSGATDSRSLGVAYGKDASGAGMWVATAGRRDRDISANVANTMAYSYDGKLWRGIAASAGLSEQAWSVAYGKDGFGVGMWVAGGYDRVCGLKWSYDGVTWNATTGASGAAVWTGMAAGRRALSVYWNGSMWLASTSDTRNGEPRGTGMSVNNASSVPGYLLYSYNGKNWLPVLAPNTYGVSITGSAQPSVYSVLPNPAILDFGSFYDDSTQRGVTIANTTARTVGAVMSSVPIENVNTIVPYGRGSLTTGQVQFLMGGDSGLVDTVVAGSSVSSGLPITSELASTTASLSTSTDGGVTWRAVPNSTRVMTKVNKILCDETTQQIVAVGTGNYSVATSTPATAGNADGWVGVFGSRMTNTRTGLFEKYGTGATWFGGAKMWIASGRAQSRRGSSLAVSVNGTVWQDAKIVSQTAAGTSLGGRGGGLTSRTTTGRVTIDTTDRTTLYTFTAFTFDNAGATGRTGPDLSACRTRYATTAPTATWAQNSSYLNMTSDASGIQLWTVPATGTYTIRAVGAAGGNPGTFGRGRDIQTSTILTKGEVIRILVGQLGTAVLSINEGGGGGGGTFVVRGTQTPIIVAGGGGGRGGSPANQYVNSNAINTTSGNKGGDGSGTLSGAGGIDGAGGSAAGNYAAGGGGLLGGGGSVNSSIGGASFIGGGVGGVGGTGQNGGFGGGGGTEGGTGGGGGGGYSGGGGGRDPPWPSGGGGGSFAISTMTDAGAINTGQGSVTITFNNFIITTSTIPISFTSSVIPYTAAATPLLTYTDSAAAFSTQVSSVATNSQYNRAVVGGSGVQFVAGGRGGIAVSNDGQNWTAAAAGTTTTVFQTPTNVAAYSTSTGSGGFDASFGTVALTQRLTVPATYVSGNFYSVSLSKTGQYQSAVAFGGNIWTSSDFGVTWTERIAGSTGDWRSVSLSSTGQYQTAAGSSVNIWTSSDYGVTWTSRATAFNWYSVSLSSTGQYQSAVIAGTANIWTSSDYGVTWISRATALNWVSVSLSSTGQYQTAMVYTGKIWTSSDYGVSWASSATALGWWCVSISSTGQYQTAVIFSATNAGNIWTSIDFGLTWTERIAGGSSKDWRSVSLSSTGQYQTAVGNGSNIWTSTDYGVTWTERTTGSTRTWRSVSISSTGQYQTAVVDTSGHIWTSTDFGVTWVQRSTATKTNAFTRIKSSASGQYQLATSGPVGNTNGQLYVSSDYGQTWMPRRGLATWLGGAVSATGAVMMTANLYSSATTAILRSTDYGATFTDVPNTSLTGTAYWRAIAMTNSAATQTALAHGSTIYRSSDTGATWNSTAAVDIVGILTTEFSSAVSPTYAWKSIAMSSDAKYQTGVVSGSGQIYVNSSYGRETWTAVDSARNWASVAMSADGRYQSAVVTSGAIYYNSTFGTGTWTAVSTPTPGFSWTSIAVSSADGKYQTAVASGATNIYVSSNYGVGTWTSKESARNWFGVAVSSTGRYQTAINRSGYIYIDSSFGEAASWTPVDSLRDWVSVAMSSTGQYQTAVVAGGKIYVNNNYGANGAWTETDSNRAWISVAVSSATGRYQTAVVQPGFIYTNANFGVGAWIPVDSSRNWVSVTISAEGKYQSAAVATSGQVYFSRDYGATWSTTAGLDIMGNRWQDVAVAAETGAVQVTCVSGGYLYVSSDTGANWVSTTVNIDGVAAQTTNRVWQAVALSANGQYGLACVNSTTATGFIYRSTNYGASWASSNISIDGAGSQTTNRPWQDVGMSANGKYQVACININNFIYYSKDYGATWTSFSAAGSRSWSSVALSENGGTISATTNDATGAIFTYTMPDDQYYRPPALLNSGSATTPATIRAITYGNSGTGAATDGYWVAGADASANTLAYSSNGIDWTAVVGSKTGLFNSVNGVAYGADLWGTMMWVAVGAPFIGSVPGSTAYSIAYSYNMTTWTGVRNLANFTGQGNHVAYGQDEYGTGMWVAVGQGSGVLAANLGSSSFGNSNGLVNTTVFYSYDGANWSAATGTGVFSTSGTDVAWGVDASGVATWVASGIGFTDPLTGVFIAGGQVAYSTNGRVWTPIRAPTAIVPALTPTTLSATTTRKITSIPPPPASTGFVASIYAPSWAQLGSEILGTQAAEYSGASVSLSADGTTVAIGSAYYDITGTNYEGRTRVYKYNNGTSSWGQLGSEILGTQAQEQCGTSVSLSADGTTLAIGTPYYNVTNSDEGRTRIYKLIGTTWTQLGLDISGNQASEYSGFSVSLSADGTTVAIGSPYYNVTSADEGRVRIYKYNKNGTSSWDPLGVPSEILGTQNGEYSGDNVSLSADGTTLAIGSKYYDKAGGTTNAGTDEGRVRIYKLIGTTWTLLGSEILGTQAIEQCGISVALSADGTTVAIGSLYYDKAGGTANTTTSEGRTRVYKYNNGTSSWSQLGPDILGTQNSEFSGISVSLSADGTTVAIGSSHYDVIGTNEGRTRVYKYNNGTLSWGQLGLDISGTQASENSGAVSLSADGTTLAIGSFNYDKAGGTTNASTDEGRVRIFKLDVTGAFFSSSNPAVADICGNGILLIKDISAGTTTITATQPAYPPFSLTPAIVQGTLTVTGTVYTLVYHTVFSTFTPFTTSALSVAYGRAGAQGAGVPLWIVGGSGGNVFAAASRPSATDAGIWSVVSAAAPTANAPFPVCNSIGYSNGIWVAGNNTDATNVLARSIDGGGTWTPVPLSSVSGILAGSASVGANAFCNYSLAYADYSNDTNMRSWVAVQGTKNFMFEGGVNTVATVSSNIVAGAYNNTNRAWWVAGGAGTSAAGVSSAALAYSTDPSGATGWTNSASTGIANLAAINDIAFSPQTQRWLAVGVGATGTANANILYSDASGMTWTASAVATSVTPVITLNTCIWNQLDASASAAGRWIAGGTRNDISVSIPTSATLYISTDISGSASPWTPIAGTGAILSQVYSIAYNGRVWIAAGAPATDSGSTSTLMRTTDPTGASGWTGIPATNASISGFDTSARSVAWNADQQMWIATGENTATAGSGSAADASFSSVIYSLDVSGSVGTWRTVRESNSSCFSGQGNGIAFTGRKWLAVGEGTNQISATADVSANAVFGTGAPPTWSSAGNANAVLPVRGTDIAFTGRNLIATGVGSGGGSGVVISTDPTGTSWSNTAAAAGFTDASGGGTSITFEPTYDGTGRLVATGKSAANSISVSSDGGATWNTSATAIATAVQFSSRQQTAATTQTLFTTGGNSVAYVGNDTLFGGGGNDIHWSGKRWVATGKNTSADAVAATTGTTATTGTVVPDIINNNTAPVAVSDDGITWQCVSSGQAPNITEGTFIATNSRIGATPLIDSRITIMDGGDTETTVDYTNGTGTWGATGMVPLSGTGSGIAQVDIIAELPVTSVSASNTTGTVGVIGVGANNVTNVTNGVGVTPTASFDNTAFTITTRPV